MLDKDSRQTRVLILPTWMVRSSALRLRAGEQGPLSTVEYEQKCREQTFLQGCGLERRGRSLTGVRAWKLNRESDGFQVESRGQRKI